MMSVMLPPYTAVIRTLGKAGEKYQTLLNSLENQTHKPQDIIVYLADGYKVPAETIGRERVVMVPKGMVAQRALNYSDVTTEWLLFLDDDMSIEEDGVERILRATLKENADVCAIDGFPHHLLPFKVKLSMFLALSSLPRLINKHKGYTINCFGADLYNPNPKTEYAWSTTNSGNAFICKKDVFLNIHFEEDLWLDEAPYAVPEDKVMFYKMHLNGLRILTHYQSGFHHLDAGTSLTDNREYNMMLSSARNNKIFVNKYLIPNLSLHEKIIYYMMLPVRCVKDRLFEIYLFLIGKKDLIKACKYGRASAQSFIRHENKRKIL